MLTVAARELTRRYIGQYQVSIYSQYPELVAQAEGVKHAGTLAGSPRGIVVELPAEHVAGCHQLVGVLDELDSRLGTDLRLYDFKPSLSLPTDMVMRTPQARGRLDGRPYWVFATGGGYDRTVSWVSREWWQRVINKLSDYADFPLLVHIGSRHDVYSVLKLQGCVEVSWRTDLLKLLWVIYHSRGVITTGTFLSHLAAAFNKPCVVLAGGHRSRWDDGYTRDVIERYGAIEQDDRRAFYGTRAQVYLDEYVLERCGAEDKCGCTHLGERGSTARCCDVRMVGPIGAKIRQAACMDGIPIDWVVDAARSEDCGD